ncbi:hypothetical protein Acr_19g0000240 [Actinidia rufa]|uniref:Uncharacterized protein n=1 Tax=Actinidia rufa TaxID=165716 RepID=A0A7J0G8G0_9ERIC|nr:hypothetical protein Acr_19g0000240 [Actinidia rufa]
MLCVSQSLEEDCVIFGNIITRIKIVGGDSVGVVTALTQNTRKILVLGEKNRTQNTRERFLVLGEKNSLFVDVVPVKDVQELLGLGSLIPHLLNRQRCATNRHVGPEKLPRSGCPRNSGFVWLVGMEMARKEMNAMEMARKEMNARARNGMGKE